MDDIELKMIENAYDTFIRDESKLTLSQLLVLAKELENLYGGVPIKWLSSNHNLEIHLYKHYINEDDDFRTTIHKLHVIYRCIAHHYIDKDDRVKAVEAFENSRRWNPFDIDTIFEMAKLFRNIQDLKQYKYLVDYCYPYCSTNSELARFYRYLGYYYVETYQPDIAEALYHYSNLYYKSEMADHEILFIRKAMGKWEEYYDIRKIIELLQEIDIPLSVNSNTLTLLHEVAELEQTNGNSEYAKYLFLFYEELVKDNRAQDTKDS